MDFSVLGLGFGWRISEDAKVIPQSIRETRFDITRKALELGINWIDTSEAYDLGHSEELLGEVIRDLPIESLHKDVFITTKVEPYHMRYSDVLKAAEGSLRRLGVDSIDLYQLHHYNPKIPIKETMKAMENLVDSGKIRFIGVSNFSLKELKEAQEALSKYDVNSNQVHYNVLTRSYTDWSSGSRVAVDEELLPYCRKEKVDILAYSAVAMGLLANKWSEDTRFPPEIWKRIVKVYGERPFENKHLIKQLEVAKALKKIGDSYGKTPAQVAVNWLIYKPEVFALFGTESASALKYLEENCGAVDWRLKENDYNRIQKILSEFNLN